MNARLTALEEALAQQQDLPREPGFYRGEWEGSGLMLRHFYYPLRKTMRSDYQAANDQLINFQKEESREIQRQKAVAGANAAMGSSSAARSASAGGTGGNPGGTAGGGWRGNGGGGDREAAAAAAERSGGALQDAARRSFQNSNVSFRIPSKGARRSASERSLGMSSTHSGGWTTPSDNGSGGSLGSGGGHHRRLGAGDSGGMGMRRRPGRSPSLSQFGSLQKPVQPPMITPPSTGGSCGGIFSGGPVSAVELTKLFKSFAKKDHVNEMHSQPKTSKDKISEYTDMLSYDTDRRVAAWNVDKEHHFQKNPIVERAREMVMFGANLRG